MVDSKSPKKSSAVKMAAGFQCRPHLGGVLSLDLLANKRIVVDQDLSRKCVGPLALARLYGESCSPTTRDSAIGSPTTRDTSRVVLSCQ